MRGMIVIMLMALSVVAGQAQETRELTRQEKKEMQARLDSLLHVEAEEAVNARAITLEADKVMFKYGETAYVTSTTNFVSVKGDDAAVQVAFNVPVSGPNGLGGVTVDGSVSSYEVEKDKRGNLLLTMNNDSQAGLTEEDLIQSLAESCSALKLCQVRALYYVNVRPLVLHDADIVQCYDYFEWLTEQLFGKMQMMFFRVVVMEEHLVISVHVDSEYDLQTLLSGRSGTEVQKEDEKEWLIRWRIS